MHIFHKWSKWVDLMKSVKPVGAIMQERRCSVCNKVERCVVFPVEYL